MRRLLPLCAAAFLAMSACVASSSETKPAPDETADRAPTIEDPDSEAERLVRRWIDSLEGEDTDTARLRTILSPDFQLVRDDGSRATREEYLAEPALVNAYEISNLHATQHGSTLVVSFDLTVDEVIGGKHIATTAPRLGSFVWDGKDWLLLSWANFGVTKEEPK